jgi:hypothetical protein
MIYRDDELYTYRMYYPSRVKMGKIHKVACPSYQTVTGFAPRCVVVIWA